MIYYGDEVDLNFWAGRYLQIGVVDGGTVFTRVPGYKYIYNATNRTADYYDDQGNKFYHRDNIRTVGDLHITYSVHKSHQFEIHINVSKNTRIYNPNY